MSKKMKWLVSASVLLNVLLAGLMLGHMSHPMDGHKSARHHSKFLEQMETISDALPPEKSQIFDEATRAMYHKIKANRKTVRHARREVIDALAAEPFDPVQYDQKVKAVRDAKGEMAREFSETFKALAMQFTADERAILVDHMHQHFNRRHHKRGHPPR